MCYAATVNNIIVVASYEAVRMTMMRLVLAVVVLIVVFVRSSQSVITTPVLLQGRDRQELISLYFHDGHSYRLITWFLSLIHGISLSVRQLKRILKRLNLRRRPPPAQRLNHCQLVKRLIAVSGFMVV